MNPIRVTPLLFRRIHKWVGLILGLQFVFWTVSGAAMALIDQDAVGGHGGGAGRAEPLSSKAPIIAPAAAASLGTAQAVTLRPLAGRPVYEFRSRNRVQLADAVTGNPVVVTATLARRVVAEQSDAPVRKVTFLRQANLEAREHDGPMWRVDLDDAEQRSGYVSMQTGQLLELRGNAWRWWDLFWMFHNMDYVNRTSFNHPLIIFVAFGVLWLSTTGFYLLFKSFRRRDFGWVLPAWRAPG